MKKITEENVKIDKMITDVTDNIIKIVYKSIPSQLSSSALRMRSQLFKHQILAFYVLEELTSKFAGRFTNHVS